jgi:hypothetical protein
VTTGHASSDAEAVVTAYQDRIQQQLDDGLRAIKNTANTLMHEVAAEVWRSAGGNKQEVGDTIIKELSRDQAIRSLIAHSDERFQALAARTGRLEDTLNALNEGVRAAREQIAQATGALGAAPAGTASTAQVRAELSQVTKQVASAFEALAERDRAIVETVNARISEHGDMIAHETARISAAMESYVQHGVVAMGQLAGSTDSQVHSITARDDGISARVQATIDERMAGLTEQLQLVYDRMASGTIALHEEMTFLSERIGVDTRETTQEIGRVVDSRARGLAQVVRSDSEALRRELVRLTEAHDEQLARVLDGRLGHVADALTNAASSMAAEVTGRIREEMSEAFRLRLDETATRMETLAEDQSRLIDTRMHEAVSAIDRNVVRLTDSVEGQFERMGRSAGKEAAAELAQAMDSRIASLAKLVRSDNEMLAEQIVADQEASKQALRAVKELQASLPADVIGMVEERLASLAESIERSNEMLVSRIDRMGERVGEQQTDEIQVVLDRMGDAMHALASLGKPAPRTSEPRIALE